MRLFTEYRLGLITLPLESLEWDEWADITRFGTKEKIREYTENLKVDIQANGIKKPPIVAWHLTSSLGEKFKVEKGHHRIQALKELRYKKVKCDMKVYLYRGTEFMLWGLKWLTKN